METEKTIINSIIKHGIDAFFSLSFNGCDKESFKDKFNYEFCLKTLKKNNIYYNLGEGVKYDKRDYISLIVETPYFKLSLNKSIVDECFVIECDDRNDIAESKRINSILSSIDKTNDFDAVKKILNDYDEYYFVSSDNTTIISKFFKFSNGNVTIYDNIFSSNKNENKLFKLEDSILNDELAFQYIKNK